jgi:hypothetical protein
VSYKIGTSHLYQKIPQIRWCDSMQYAHIKVFFYIWHNISLDYLCNIKYNKWRLIYLKYDWYIQIMRFFKLPWQPDFKPFKWFHLRKWLFFFVIGLCVGAYFCQWCHKVAWIDFFLQNYQTSKIWTFQLK